MSSTKMSKPTPTVTLAETLKTSSAPPGIKGFGKRSARASKLKEAKDTINRLQQERDVTIAQARQLGQEKEESTKREAELKEKVVEASAAVDGFEAGFTRATPQAPHFDPSLDASKLHMYKEVVDRELVED
ncbi:hypothetical protein VNO80_01502 [Phaseolus coccineus]|uniref:Uncharacterized protein n=1 Tax=Phaseolus coccineus TaxID=3886 RepID=A0AAN9WWW3_PHACN